MIRDYESYKYVELLVDPSKPSAYGIRFLKENTENSITIRRRTVNGKIVGGIDIPSKHHLEKLFGIIGTQQKTTHYNVKKDQSSENILIVYPK